MKLARFTPYTDDVAGCRRLALIGLLAFACLPGALRARSASDRAYTIHLPGSTPPAKIELSVAQTSAEWEVTADYDAARCEVHCSWRRKRDEFEPSALLPPPIATIRIYSDFVSPPESVTADPAGLGFPRVTRDLPLSLESIFMPARRLFAMSPAQRDGDGTHTRPRLRFLSSSKPLDAPSASSLPLRI